VEQSGIRRTDLRLAWSQDEANPLDEARIKACWPDSCESRPLGPNLQLVFGVAPARSNVEAAPESSALSQEPPRAIAQCALDLARVANDPARVVTALGDLGLAQLLEDEIQLAVVSLEEALAEARRLGDRALEADAASNLAYGLCALGQPGRAVIS